MCPIYVLCVLIVNILFKMIVLETINDNISMFHYTIVLTEKYGGVFKNETPKFLLDICSPHV